MDGFPPKKPPKVSGRPSWSSSSTPAGKAARVGGDDPAVTSGLVGWAQHPRPSSAPQPQPQPSPSTSLSPVMMASSVARAGGERASRSSYHGVSAGRADRAASPSQAKVLMISSVAVV